MSNVLDDNEQQQICALGRLGWTLLRIQHATGVRRETVGAYLRAAGIPVRGRGRPSEDKSKAAITGGVSTDSEPKPAISPSEVSTDARATRAPSASACEPYRELIAAALACGRNAVAIYQDLVDDHGFTAKYASVRRFVGKLRGASPAEARVVITTAPGEEGQVDYGGDGPMVRDPSTGKYKRVRVFVLTLGYSRKCVRLLSWRSSARIWAELHERAFRRLGGTVKVIVPDNLKEGVLTPDVYDPTINPLYRDVLAHYGVVALPCRVSETSKQPVSRRAGPARSRGSGQRAPQMNGDSTKKRHKRLADASLWRVGQSYRASTASGSWLRPGFVAPAGARPITASMIATDAVRLGRSKGRRQSAGIPD